MAGNTSKRFNSTLPNYDAEIKLKLIDDKAKDDLDHNEKEKIQKKKIIRDEYNYKGYIDKKMRKKSLPDVNVNDELSNSTIVQRMESSLETIESGNLLQMHAKDPFENSTNTKVMEQERSSQEHAQTTANNDNKWVEVTGQKGIRFRPGVGQITYAESCKNKTKAPSTLMSKPSASEAISPRSVMYTSGRSSIISKIPSLDDDYEEYGVYLNTKYDTFKHCTDEYKRGRSECQLCKLSDKFNGKIPRNLMKRFYQGDPDGDTPLHIAIVQEDIHVSMCLILRALYSGALNMKDNTGVAPLHLCAITENAAIARLLLSKGAYVDLQDGNGDTALHIACRQKKPNLKLIQALTVPIRQDELGKQTHCNLAYKLVPQNPAITNAAGKTVLHEAVGDIKVLEYLQSPPMNVDINIQHGGTGETVLHTAVKTGKNNVVFYLLNSYGINIEAQTFSKDTPLSLAFGSKFNDIADILKKRGADEDYAMWKYRGEEEFNEEENIGHDENDPLEMDMIDPPHSSFDSNSIDSEYD